MRYDGDRQQMIGTRNENEGNFYLWWSAFYVAYILPLLFVLSFSLVLFFWMVKWIRGCWITSSWANCIDRYVFKYDLLFILLFILFKVWFLQNKIYISSCTLTYNSLCIAFYYSYSCRFVSSSYQGSVAYVSRSGGMSNELNNMISRNTDGVYEGVAIGGDRYPCSRFLDHILRYNDNPSVHMLVLLGEVGGKYWEWNESIKVKSEES